MKLPNKLRFGYKLVTRLDTGRIFAPFTKLADDAVRYSLLKLTVQDRCKRGPFAVFDELSDALGFYGECNVKHYGIPKILGVAYSESNFFMLWHRDWLRSRHWGDTPSGTVFADLVLPLMIVQTNNAVKALASMRRRLVRFNRLVEKGMKLVIMQDATAQVEGSQEGN
jgi:hypothetical protein